MPQLASVFMPARSQWWIRLAMFATLLVAGIASANIAKIHVLRPLRSAKPLAIAAYDLDTGSPVLRSALDFEALSKEISESIKPASATKAEPAAQPDPWQDVSIKHGDNLSSIFHRLSLAVNDMHQILDLGNSVKLLKQLHAGRPLRIKVAAGRVQELRYSYSTVEALRVYYDGRAYRAALEIQPTAKRVNAIAVTIDDSIFVSGKAAGLSDRLLLKLIRVFRWDIDFALDLRAGDRFALVYEEIFADGKKIKDGDILAAEFVNNGKVHRAVRYQNANGDVEYLSPQGQGMRKAFLRTPVKFRRISSLFNPRRRHPLLHRLRAHRGVDYAAPIGTPVKATADGKVRFAGSQRGYGRTIVLQHGSQYSTLYGHLSRYAKGLKAGKPVRQGEIIGFVGKSGLATGPHLHYEFRINEVHKDPLTVALPKTLATDRRRLADLKAKTAQWLAQLDTLRKGEPLRTAAVAQAATRKTRTAVR